MIFTTAAAVLLLAQTTAESPVVRPAPPRCEGEIYEAFDFWVGEWNVFGPDGEKQAKSRIEKISAGCAIRETWMPLRGGGGGSITAYDPKTATWQQTWVGQVPGRVYFEGGPVDGKMILTGYWGKTPDGDARMIRMTLGQLDDGAVRQHGQMSTDHGMTWADSFDLIYRPKE